MEETSFGLNKKSSNIEDYIGEWVVINSKIAGPLAGYLANVDVNDVMLKPYQEINYNDSGFPYAAIESDRKPYKIPREDVGPIKTVSKKSIENNCIYLNRKFQSEAMKDEKENRELKSYFNQISRPSQLDILYGGSKD